MNLAPYTYSILQYRHDVWTGEAMNVGILLHCPSRSYISLKVQKPRKRLGQAYPDLDHGALRQELSLLERHYERQSLIQGDFLGPQSSGDFGRSVLPHDDSSLQWLPEGSGLTSDVEKTHEEIFFRLVKRYESQTDRGGRTDDMVFETVKRKLRLAALYDKFESHTVSSKYAEVTFEHSYKNGVWHCVQPLSFDSKNAERMQDKAQRWAGKLHSLQECSESVRPYIVAGPPRNLALMNKYKLVLEYLRTSPLSPLVVDEEQSDLVVERIAEAASS